MSLRSYAAAESVEVALLRDNVGLGSLYYADLGRALIDEGHWRAADSIARAEERHFGHNIDTDGIAADVYYQHGQLDSAVAIVGRWKNSPNAFTRSLGLLTSASLDERGGKLAEWAHDRASMETIDRQRGAFVSPVADSVHAALMDVWFLNQPTRAVGTLDAALAAYPLKSLPVMSRPYGSAASAYAMAGRPDLARKVLAELDRDVRDTSQLVALSPDRHAGLGAIALAEKRPLDALREYRASDSLPDGPSSECAACVSVYLALAFDQANMPDSAIVQFTKYLDTPYFDKLTVDADNLAIVQRRLGELYEAKGDAEKAAEHYRAFIDLWKNADPELQPQVAEVRRWLAKLTPVEKPRN
jgi:tetratricopeptide (TPR) repeat protein